MMMALYIFQNSHLIQWPTLKTRVYGLSGLLCGGEFGKVGFILSKKKFWGEDIDAIQEIWDQIKTIIKEQIRKDNPSYKFFDAWPTWNPCSEKSPFKRSKHQKFR